MTTFDPVEFRKAVAEFTPPRPQKFQDIIPAKEVIVELRQRGASYRSIADLLTQYCLPTSKTAVAMFCHQVLGENIRTKPLSPPILDPNADWFLCGATLLVYSPTPFSFNVCRPEKSLLFYLRCESPTDFQIRPDGRKTRDILKRLETATRESLDEAVWQKFAIFHSMF